MMLSSSFPLWRESRSREARPRKLSLDWAPKIGEYLLHYLNKHQSLILPYINTRSVNRNFVRNDDQCVSRCRFQNMNHPAPCSGMASYYVYLPKKNNPMWLHLSFSLKYGNTGAENGEGSPIKASQTLFIQSFAAGSKSLQFIIGG